MIAFNSKCEYIKNNKSFIGDVNTYNMLNTPAYERMKSIPETTGTSKAIR